VGTHPADLHASRAFPSRSSCRLDARLRFRPTAGIAPRPCRTRSARHSEGRSARPGSGRNPSTGLCVRRRRTTTFATRSRVRGERLTGLSIACSARGDRTHGS
jgi:hypothetical protein